MSVAKRFHRAGIFAVAVLALGAMASTASAFGPRVPQVAFSNGPLQAYLTGVGESINTLTDQLDAQSFQSSISGNATFTLMIELTGNAAQNSIGVYNGADASPALNQLFPGSAAAGWFVTCHFSSGGGLTVFLFDDTATLQGTTTYAGVDGNNFGFYLQGPGGTFYSQDARNGGAPQALTYAGTGQNFGDWWECFEDHGYAAGGSDFADAILLLQSVAPTPARAGSWGALKSSYR